jgi:putative membrane protein
MVAMALTGNVVAARGAQNALLTFLAGVAGSSAMILPGVSGGYLLLLLGQYESILGTVDQLKVGLLGDGAGAGPDLALILDAMHVVIPLGLGIVAGVVGVSNLLQWLLHRYEKATLGALLGLLFGAVVGLWPFQQAYAPQVGDVIKGQVVTPLNASDFEPDDWPVRFFDPTPMQGATAIGLVGLGLAATLLIGRLGGDGNETGGGGAVSPSDACGAA